jgi:hypothetical protein
MSSKPQVKVGWQDKFLNGIFVGMMLCSVVGLIYIYLH